MARRNAPFQKNIRVAFVRWMLLSQSTFHPSTARPIAVRTTSARTIRPPKQKSDLNHYWSESCWSIKYCQKNDNLGNIFHHFSAVCALWAPSFIWKISWPLHGKVSKFFGLFSNNHFSVVLTSAVFRALRALQRRDEIVSCIREWNGPSGTLRYRLNTVVYLCRMGTMRPD